MANVKELFPFNEIKKNKAVDKNCTKNIFFPKMYFCNKTLTSGPYKGRTAYLVSKYGGDDYHLAPTFYNKGTEAKEGVYFAKYSGFPEGKTDGWSKGNIYDYHFLLRLYLISGEDYGGFIKRAAHYSLGKIPDRYLSGETGDSRSPVMLPDNKRQGQYVPDATFLYQGHVLKGHWSSRYDSYYHKVYYLWVTDTNKDFYVKSFNTRKGEGYNFGDLFLPGEYTENSKEAITKFLEKINTSKNKGKLCFHVNNPPDEDIFQQALSEGGWNDNCSKEQILYVKVV